MFKDTRGEMKSRKKARRSLKEKSQPEKRGVN